EACIALDSDAQRLACYDAALGRVTTDPKAADLAAAAASQAIKAEKQALSAAPEEDRRSDLFAHDELQAVAANSGKGSLLDSRWELAKDSKLGTFQLRAYKPVYLLPAFWSSKPNQMPQSPNPRNSVD